MADYDSDSSGEGDGIETNVLLGYASKEATGDDFSQLGGKPIWLDLKTPPSGAFAKCKICSGVMNLLLQLHGDVPDRFAGHERRLYVFGCRKKSCRRKHGSIRALRATRTSSIEAPDSSRKGQDTTAASKPPVVNLGETLFGVKSPTPAQANPFASATSSISNENPFSSTKFTKSQDSDSSTPKVNDLAETFAQKAKISATSLPTQPKLDEPWPDDPTPYPEYYIDADKEYLDPASQSEGIPQNARLEPEGGSGNAADDKAAFESSMDKTFQRFADRLSQNPEQVLRYEFAGQPLLYSKNDKVGKALSPATESKVQTSYSNGSLSSHPLQVPRCASCGAARVFELQLTPNAITELEADDAGLDGMDWGTIVVAVCAKDCSEQDKGKGKVGYVEEWVGVQWEEIANYKK